MIISELSATQKLNLIGSLESHTFTWYFHFLSGTLLKIFLMHLKLVILYSKGLGVYQC